MADRKSKLVDAGLAGPIHVWWTEPAAEHSMTDYFEQALAVVLILSRSTVVIVALIGLFRGATVATRPALAVAVFLFLGFSLVLLSQVVRKRRLPALYWWGFADFGVSVGFCVIAALIHWLSGWGPTDPWVAWGGGVVGNVVTTLGAYARKPRDVAYLPVLCGTYLMAGIATTGFHLQLLADSVSWLGFGVAAYFFTRWCRQMADEADRLRAVSNLEAQNRALDEARKVVHDPAAILRLLADPATPQASLTALRQQAAVESQRLRSFMADNHQPDPRTVNAMTPSRRTVETAVLTAANGFADLPIQMSLELARDAELSAEAYPVLVHAVTTCLHNVREHARASEVVLHGDLEEGQWEVTIYDNGRGFDPAHQPLGQGLQRLVVDALGEVGATATIQSSPGNGCQVTMTGWV